MENRSLLDHENAEHILHEGWLLFQLKGYRGVSINELCQRCGITKPTLYYYFEDKENLFVQVLQYKLHGFHKATDTPGTLPERLEAVAILILDSFQTEYSTILRDREHIKKPENFQKIKEAFHRELFGPLQDIMQSGIDRRELKGESSEVLTLIFLGIVNNFIGKDRELHTRNDSLARMLIRYFLEGAGAK